MPPFRRRASVIDADRIDESASTPGGGGDAERARALAEEAEAEAAEAEAAAAAARARARALRLRREAEEAVQASSAGEPTDQIPDIPTDVAAAEDATDATDVPDAPDAGAAEDATDATDVADAPDAGAAAEGATEVPDADQRADVEDAAPARRRRPRLPRPTWRGIVAALVILVTAALLALSGYMIWEHREAERLRQLDAEYSAAARQSVVTLMSLNFNNAEEDVQRIIDNSTGEFKDDFELQAQDFVQVAQDSKVITEVSVNATGVESMTEDSAVVLVADPAESY